MNWRKRIREVIDDIISGMELISEVVENDGHIIVYIKNDMVNYCPYAFHIIYVKDDCYRGHRRLKLGWNS